jgi:hypothetical protein
MYFYYRTDVLGPLITGMPSFSGVRVHSLMPILLVYVARWSVDSRSRRRGIGAERSGAGCSSESPPQACSGHRLGAMRGGLVVLALADVPVPVRAWAVMASRWFLSGVAARGASGVPAYLRHRLLLALRAFLLTLHPFSISLMPLVRVHRRSVGRLWR